MSAKYSNLKNRFVCQSFFQVKTFHEKSKSSSCNPNNCRSAFSSRQSSYSGTQEVLYAYFPLHHRVLWGRCIPKGQNLIVLVTCTFHQDIFKWKQASFKMQKVWRLLVPFGATVLICAKILNCLGLVLVTNMLLYHHCKCQYSEANNVFVLLWRQFWSCETLDRVSGTLRKFMDHPWEDQV